MGAERVGNGIYRTSRKVAVAGSRSSILQQPSVQRDMDMCFLARCHSHCHTGEAEDTPS